MLKTRKFFLVFALMFFSLLHSNMAPEGFERFLNDVFVETGTQKGNGILFALRAGFADIHSVEILDDFVNNARKMFRNYDNVRIWQGDSGIILWDVIKEIDKPITFWLDGHAGMPQEHGNNTPLLAELEQIKKHPIKTHTILIDDMHCCGTVLFDYLTKEQIKAKVLEINTDYTITYVDGGDQAEYKDNIMVAMVK